MWTEMTWESALMIACLDERGWSFDRASMIASYSVLLFVHWNSSLAAYMSLMPDGEIKIGAMLAPTDPHTPSVCTVHIGSVTSAML
jgi:hypothetical protein